MYSKVNYSFQFFTRIGRIMSIGNCLNKLWYIHYWNIIQLFKICSKSIFGTGALQLILLDQKKSNFKYFTYRTLFWGKYFSLGTEKFWKICIKIITVNNLHNQVKQAISILEIVKKKLKALMTSQLILTDAVIYLF